MTTCRCKRNPRLRINVEKQFRSRKKKATKMKPK